jgi:hypothetical protein
MKTFTKTTVTEEPRLQIRYDCDPESPREWSNLGYFITKDRDYHSPDKDETLERIIAETGDEAESLEKHMELITNAIKNQMDDEVLAIYPVVKYEHGGIAYSLGAKHGFDYSNNGFYIVTKKSQKETGSAKRFFRKIIEEEIAEYNKYANGEVYYFNYLDREGTVIDSVGGIYDIDDIKTYLPKSWSKEDMSDYLIQE